MTDNLNIDQEKVQEALDELKARDRMRTLYALTTGCLKFVFNVILLIDIILLNIAVGYLIYGVLSV